MNKNNLMSLIVLLFIFSLLLAVPKVNSAYDAGAGFGGSSDEPSPAEITKPVEFPEGYLDLIDKEEKTFEDWEAIEGMEEENNLGYVEVGDVKIPLNTETHDGNIGGATADTFELKGGLGGDLISFKTLTSKSGKVVDVSRAEDIEKIIIKDGEIAEIVFSKIDESNENLNEVLYSSDEGKGIWFSPPTPEEGESEETNVQIDEFGEGTISIKATAGINIEISGKENSEIIAKTELEMNVNPLEKGSNYIEGTHLTLIKGGISVDGKEENLKITLLPNKEDKPELTIIEEHEDQIGMRLIEISSLGKEPSEKNIYMNCNEDKIGDDEDKIIYSFGDIKEETQTQIDATRSSGIEITTAVKDGNEVTAKCDEDKTVKISTWDLIKNAANKAISDINYFFKPGEYDVGGALGIESGEISDIIESTDTPVEKPIEEEKPQTTISFPFTQPTSSEGAGGGGAGVIESAEEEETSEETIKIDVEASGLIKAGIEAASQQEEAETDIHLLQTEKESQLLLQNKIQETLTKFKDSNSLLFDSISEKEYNDYRIEKLEKVIENLDPSDTDYKENIIYLEEKKEILTNRNSELDLLLKDEVIQEQYNEYLELKDEEANIDKSLGETETKLNEIEASTKQTPDVEVKPPEDLNDDILQIIQQPPPEYLAENTEKAKAVLETVYNRVEEGKNAQHCWDACAKTYEAAGAGWQTVFVNLPEGDDRKVSVNAPTDEQRDNLVSGDIVEYHIPGKDYGHNVIFIEWINKETCQARVAQQSTSTSPIIIREQSLCGDKAPIIVWQPV